jgi:anti-sigma regulatory factor (Ser/Thr protein kinase)
VGNLEDRLVLTNAGEGLASALDRLEGHYRAAAFGAEAVLDLRLVAEELLTNIARYAFEAEAGPVEVRLRISGASAALELRDAGRAFDPLAQPAPDLEAPLETRGPGGLGLVLVRALVDEASYRREGRSNVLRIVKHRCRP